MKRKYYYISILLIVLQLTSCLESQNSNAKILWNLEGPFLKEQIESEFNLDSISNGNTNIDFFILSIENNHNVVKSIETNKEHQIFPYSSDLHSFYPYSSETRCWQAYSYSKKLPAEMYTDSLMEKGKRSKFWFNTYYDKYADTLYAHFEFKDPETKDISRRTFWKTFEKQVKPNINYQLIEVDISNLDNEKNEIELKIDGPFTYAETNKLLNTNINYEIDSKEVFHLNLKNNGEDTVYLENWTNSEILMDTIYSYNTFTLSSNEKQWNLTRYNKSETPIDTVKISPNESHRFWFNFTQITPNIDSIAFEKTFETENFLITQMKLYKVLKLENQTSQ